MTKLHLKRTPAEEAERARRKARKAARRAHKSHTVSDDHDSDSRHGSSDRKRRRTPVNVDDDDSDVSYGPPPPEPSSSAHKPDYDEIRAQVEEERFREKMWGAYGDDERLDSVEARFNDYAHVPHRWRAGGTYDGYPNNEPATDPKFMDDDEYAEWIREGMWRKTHAHEFEEQARKESERVARRARDAELKAETKRLEKAAEEARRRKKRDKDRRKNREYRLEYDRRWKVLLEGNESLVFEDIPWPSFSVRLPAESKSRASAVISVEGLTAQEISAFLIPVSTTAALAREVGVGLPPDERERKERKEKLRETMLRFHPDKFEGRILSRVREKDKVIVKEAAEEVARVLTTLMGG
ncbi:hypothetical protein SERLA73DRAFT_133919 [Serpula lacrymans var. lacrymans S7.3]|uniref:Uncharacterized protein n=2 Tax=Serpula lacrymans var. lacrymans TaxID=341189 RepID=F8PSY7_SERL3|nr:uncharacterized protein SERLADRAFT_385165 [Serpula lacrymans var. lacrymans S7.9]EGO00845.1 hypothetical protein SERLA73DRAFT_133919 [Serpula lacrymans var. lacrymans S7.3]EGO26468.1 hypothetical protein SERLADRAFT_385165 [Serpula lacrymans var. lacrymans S7.9]